MTDGHSLFETKKQMKRNEMKIRKTHSFIFNEWYVIIIAILSTSVVVIQNGNSPNLQRRLHRCCCVCVRVCVGIRYVSLEMFLNYIVHEAQDYGSRSSNHSIIIIVLCKRKSYEKTEIKYNL